MTQILPYKDSDYPMLKKWWEHAGSTTAKEFIPIDSTWVAYIDNRPAVAISVYTTNIRAFAYLENFVGNPALAGSERREASKALIQWAEQWAYSRGYARLVCISYVPRLKEYYAELGYTPTLEHVTTFCKELS